MYPQMQCPDSATCRNTCEANSLPHRAEHNEARRQSAGSRKGVRLLSVTASALMLCVLQFVASSAASAQSKPPTRKPPLIGSVSPGAIGPAAPTPRKIGGLETRPLGSPAPEARQGSNTSQGRRGLLRRPYAFVLYDQFGNGYYPLAVADAPYPRSGVVMRNSSQPERASAEQYARYAAPRWFPTVDKPTWRTDTTLTPVQAWRDLIVNDFVCDAGGTCIQREQRVRAPWVAACRCYMFADALGRKWEVN